MKDKILTFFKKIIHSLFLDSEDKILWKKTLVSLLIIGYFIYAIIWQDFSQLSAIILALGL